MIGVKNKLTRNHGIKIWGQPNLKLNKDYEINITIPTIQTYTINFSVSGFEEDGVSIDANLRSLNKPFGAWENNTTNEDKKISFAFDSIKKGDYILSFRYDDNEYIYDANGSGSLKKDHNG